MSVTHKMVDHHDTSVMDSSECPYVAKGRNGEEAGLDNLRSPRCLVSSSRPLNFRRRVVTLVMSSDILLEADGVRRSKGGLERDCNLWVSCSKLRRYETSTPPSLLRQGCTLSMSYLPPQYCAPPLPSYLRKTKPFRSLVPNQCFESFSFPDE
ncbi:hypothetical protein BDR04DRAFT_661883 [Suillus decipiens]|nr:hypothetical protein BDR04DRAFT_661883 [Suillus decipiens]